MDATARRAIGLVLLASAVAMAAGALASGLGVVPIDPSMRTPLAVALFVAAAVDAIVALRFFGER